LLEATETAHGAAGGPYARGGIGEQIQLWAPPALLFVVGTTIWQIGALLSDNILLPTFSDTMAALVDLLVGGTVWGPLWASNQTMLVGFAIAVALAVPTGLVMGRVQAVDRALNPWVAVMIVAPQAPLLPIIVMMVGLNFAAGVLLVVTFTYVYVVLNVRAGIRSVDRGLIEMAHSFGASERRVWTEILIPGAMPAIATGLRIGLGRAFAGMILGELLLLSRGIGLLILEFRGSFQSSYLFAVVGVLLLEALVISFAMRRLEARFVR
jgi:NitT/TauT family transport system permease protein